MPHSLARATPQRLVYYLRAKRPHWYSSVALQVEDAIATSEMSQSAVIASQISETIGQVVQATIGQAVKQTIQATENTAMRITDAAVTSVSSAAVASGQHTTEIINRLIKKATAQIKRAVRAVSLGNDPVSLAEAVKIIPG